MKDRLNPGVVAERMRGAWLSLCALLRWSLRTKPVRHISVASITALVSFASGAVTVWAFFFGPLADPTPLPTPIPVPTLAPAPTPTPTPLTCDFNIAVAQFGEIVGGTADTSTFGTDVSQQIASFLDGAFNETNFGLEVCVGHEYIGIERDRSGAAALAARMGADMVVYGTYVSVGDDAIVTPSYYVDFTPATLGFTGRYELETRKINQHSADDRINKVASIQNQYALIAEFSKGIIYLADRDKTIHHREAALDSFRLAEEKAAAAGEPLENQQAIFTLVAESFRLEDYLDNALDYSEKALSADPDYGLGHLVQGNVLYELGHSQCDRDVLLSSRKAYDEARNRGFQLPRIKEAAYTGLGNVDLVIGLLDGNASKYASALSNHGIVINEWEKTGDRGIMDLAAAAYYGKGLALQRQLRYEDAEQALSKAYELTIDDELSAKAQARIVEVQNREQADTEGKPCGE